MLSVLRQPRTTLFCLVFYSCIATGEAYGQFTTILNVPPDPDIGDNQSIGSDTQINLFDGGAIGNSFDAGASGGASTNIELNIAGGSVGNFFKAFSGSTVNFSGGAAGDDFDTFSGSVVNISGGEFRLDGVLVGGLDTVGNSLAFNLPTGSMLSGTLVDGTPFAFSSRDEDRIVDGVLTLIAATLPPLGPALIVLPNDPVPLGIRTGQTLVVDDGGAVGDNFNAGRGSTVVVSGGQVGRNFEAVGAEVAISSGSVGRDFDAFSGSTVNLSGGAVGDRFDAFSGSTVNISGGAVGSVFQTFSGSTVNLSGGTVGDFLGAGSGSTVNISGSNFRLDDMPIDGLNSVGDSIPFNVAPGFVLSGTLTDGTSFAFLSVDGDFIADGVLTLKEAAIPPIDSTEISLPSDPVPLGIRNGQTLMVNDGGAVGDNFGVSAGSTVVVDGGQVGRNFEAIGAEVTISSGAVGRDFDAFYGTTVNITGGAVDRSFSAFDDSTVNISGGAVGDQFDAFFGSTVNISGGAIGNLFDANSNSAVNISGGAVGSSFDAFSGSTVNISGGAVGDDFDADSGSAVNLFGTQFVLDNTDITSLLTPNVPIAMLDREVTLEGVLADGSPFSFDLNSTNVFGEDYFDPGATLTITLFLEGDYNANGVVDAADYTVWRDNLGSSVFMPGDATPGTVTQADYDVWKMNFGQSAGSGSGLSSALRFPASPLHNAVPESSTALLSIVPLAVLLLLRHREHGGL